MTGLRGVRALTCGLVLVAVSQARANPASATLRATAAAATYSLDHDVAMATFTEAVKAAPAEAAAYAGLASAGGLAIAFRAGKLPIRDLPGRPDRSTTSPLPPPPPDTVAAFNNALDTAIGIARKAIQANPRDP